MISYDPSKGIVVTALRMHATVIPLVLLKAEFYILLGINLSICYAVRTGYYDPFAIQAQLSMKLTTITGSLMTFFVVFYNGNAFSRYQKLYELVKGMIESSLYIASIIEKEIADRSLVRKLGRWLMASLMVFFFERSDPNKRYEGITNREWHQLLNLGLLNERERDTLMEHCRNLRHHSIPSFMLIHWSMKLYRSKSPRIPDLDKAYFALRKCMEDVVMLLDLPMPFQYFHIMNLMLMLNLCLWAYALAIHESDFAPLIFFFVQLMFQGLRELSVALADPFGDDDTDFPLNEWMTTLYVRLYNLIEVTLPVTLDHHQDVPLPPLKPGEEVVDVCMDLADAPPPPSTVKALRKTVKRDSARAEDGELRPSEIIRMEEARIARGPRVQKSMVKKVEKKKNKDDDTDSGTEHEHEYE
eukprot:TRINITY_DN21834_c0_g1_i1.p1 TRINITY_DN21834_c0_g1~~TRINITY_DN21834_c0_g1_i1.p1  ORF type:complete len:414 (-),score=57.74 TRINITY_DN21834_c0_g1_i1:109-1350(-)